MIINTKAPGPIYLGKVNSKHSIDRFLRICLDDYLIEKVILIDPYINDFTLLFLDRLANAEIEPILLAQANLDKNPLNAQARAIADIYQKIKVALPNNSYIFDQGKLNNFNFLEIFNIEKWKNNELLILLPFELNSFFLFSALLNINLNGQLKEFEVYNASNFEDIIKLSKAYQKIIANQKTLN